MTNATKKQSQRKNAKSSSRENSPAGKEHVEQSMSTSLSLSTILIASAVGSGIVAVSVALLSDTTMGASMIPHSSVDVFIPMPILSSSLSEIKYAPWFIVFLYTMLGAFTPILGCLPLAMVDSISAHAQGCANAITAGVMSAASYELIREGIACSVENASYLVLVGVIAGFLFISIAHEWIEHYNITIGDLQGASARRALLIMGVMTLHSFAEGLGIGVSFAGASGAKFGKFIALAIALHNIPEGLAVGLSLVPKGESPRRAIVYSVISSLPQPIVAVPAFLLVEMVQSFLPIGLGIAAGAMLWLVLLEILPEALEVLDIASSSIVFLLGLGLMILFSSILHDIEAIYADHRQGHKIAWNSHVSIRRELCRASIASVRNICQRITPRDCRPVAH